MLYLKMFEGWLWKPKFVVAINTLLWCPDRVVVDASVVDTDAIVEDV